MSKKPKTIKYKIKGRIGRTDLSWLSFHFDCDPYDQEAIDKESAERTLWNEAYIAKVKADGTYNNEYIITVKLLHNPVLDTPQTFEAPLSSYRMIFIDVSNPKS